MQLVFLFAVLSCCSFAESKLRTDFRTGESYRIHAHTHIHMYVCTYLLRGGKCNTCRRMYMCWGACACSTLQWLHNEKGCGLIKEARDGENERRLDVTAEAQLDLQGLFLNKGLEHKTKRISLRRNLRKKKKKSMKQNLRKKKKKKERKIKEKGDRTRESTRRGIITRSSFVCFNFYCILDTVVRNVI